MCQGFIKEVLPRKMLRERETRQKREKAQPAGHFRHSPDFNLVPQGCSRAKLSLRAVCSLGQ